MRICILNVLHDPDDKRVFQKVARSLVDGGHQVISVVPATKDLPTGQGVEFETIPPARSLPHRLMSVMRLIRKGRKVKADVYVGVEPESWVAALVIKLFLRCKVVFDVHEYVPTEFAKFFPRFLQGFMAWLTLKFMRGFARCTDHIILTRNSFDNQFRGLNVPRTVVINTNHVQPPCTDIPRELRDRYGEHPTLIHQGLFGDVRGSWQLLDAVKIVAAERPNLKCIVLGKYAYGNLDDYKSAIHDANLDGVFDIIDWVPYEAVPAYIAVSDAGLILFQPGPINHTLAMPHKLFDYMRESVPVVAPAFALEVKTIMEDAGCGLLVDVTRPEAIAEAILTLLNDADEAARLGANGREAVEQKYNWQAEEAKLLAAFASLE